MRKCITNVIMLAVLPLSIGAAQQSPYAGMEKRSIKALSAEQVDGYLSGKGMSLALAAELNGFPGPKHVLDLSAELELDDEQRQRVALLFDGMNEGAVSLGRDIIEAETRLDAAFADRTMTAESLREQLAALGRLYGELRFTHLVAHLQTVTVLSGHQIMQYQEMRGYGGDAGHRHGDRPVFHHNSLVPAHAPICAINNHDFVKPSCIDHNCLPCRI